MKSKYQCIIVDDEPLARDGIKLHVNEIPWLSIAGEFGNAIKAAEFLNTENTVSLIFLDIEMPGLNGIEFLKTVPTSALVILTTAYPQYALDAFELDVIDYLLKPIKFERFFKSVNKAREILLLQQNISSPVTNPDDNDIYIKSERKFVKLKYEEIRFIKGLKDYVILNTSKGKHMTAMNIKTILSKLPKENFARISKSYIINTSYVTSIDVDSVYLDNETLPLGNTYKEAFLQNHIASKLLKR